MYRKGNLEDFINIPAKRERTTFEEELKKIISRKKKETINLKQELIQIL